jgi:hypothetical protein
VITFDGDRMRIAFDRFDREAYEVFKKAKTIAEYRVETNHDSLTWVLECPARFAGVLGWKCLPP